MSVSRGLFLKRLVSNSPAQTKRFRLVFTILTLFGLIGAFAMSARLNWLGMAADEERSANSSAATSNINCANEKTSRAKTLGPILGARREAAFEPFQACTLNCNATVPGTGQVNTAVQFQGSATTSGCAGQPTYDWNFGDGTARSSQQNPTHAYTTAGTFTWTLTTSVSSGATGIDTVVGGVGEGNPAAQAPFGTAVAITRDPQGRGLYIVDLNGGVNLIRFVNTTASTVTLGGRSIAPGLVRAIAGGGLDIGENVPGLQADLGNVSGIGVSGNGDVVYFVDQTDSLVRAVNVSANAVTIGNASIGSGRVGTLAQGFGSVLNGMTVNTTSGDVFVIDATAGVNKVFKITANGTVSTVAGNGAGTMPTDGFSAGAATNVPLLQPRAVDIDASGNLIIADTGHGRVIRVDGGGTASLVNQFPLSQSSPNPFPSGVVVQGGNVYTANGNQATVTRVTNGVTRVAGTVNPTTNGGVVCDYTSSNCGDGGAGTNAGLNLNSSTANPPIAGLESDGSGLYILDQGPSLRGRVRYLNLTGGSVTILGVTIPAGAIDTIIGNGLVAPYDGGLATGAAFNTPVGVAVDPNGNLWISDTINARVRFVNRGASPITIFANTAAAQTVQPGRIVTVNKDVGNGATDGAPVNQASFDAPQGLWATSQGVFIADSKNGPAVPPQTIDNKRTSIIRYINTTANTVTIYPGSIAPIVVPPGNIAKIAGGSDGSTPGDGSFALNARFIAASDVVVTSNGTIYVADVGQKLVRKIDPNTGVVSSLTLAQAQYTGLGLDSTGRLYIANFDGNNVLRENSVGGGSFSTFVSNLTKPRDVAVASDGTAYVTVSPRTIDAGNHQIVQVSSGGTPTVIAGGVAGFGGDGGPASGAQLNISPSDLVIGAGVANRLPQTVGIAVGPTGDVYFTDTNNDRVRRISASQVVCTKTGQITISGDNPAPQVTTINPTSALQGSGALTLTVNGNGFVPASKVRWNGQDRTTTFVSQTQVTASIPATDLTNAGSATVTVFTPAPGGGTSNSVTFTITPPNPVPSLTSINPASATEGSAGFLLTVTGTGFVNGSIVRWDGQNRSTNFVSSTQLTAQILSSDLVGTGQASVTVFNPTPGGGTSNVINFTITSGNNPVPALTSLSPNSATAGSPAFTLTVNGSNFTGTSVVRWNGQDRQTTIVSSTQLQANILAGDVASATTASVTVFNPTPGGGVSAPLSFTVTPVSQVTPSITSLNPAGVAAGGPAFILTVNGSNFVNGAVVRVNNANRATTFVSATQLTASVLPGDIATAGQIPVTVVNPGATGGTSNAVNLAVVPPVASVSAASFLGAAIAPESIVAAFGVNMATGIEVASTRPLPTTLLGTTVKVKDSAGSERNASLFFVAPGQINYLVPAGTAEGAATVTVVTNGVVTGVGTLPVAKIGPGLISANSNGLGVAAADVLRVVGTAQTYERPSTFDAGQSRFVPVPIDLGPENNEVYLVLYGTGFRGNSGLANVKVTVGGVNVPVGYAGLSPDFIGLDQCNVGPLPRSLAGRGVVDVVLTVDTKIANTVQVQIK